MIDPTATLVAQLNPTWRIVRVEGPRWGMGAAWLIENVTDPRAGAVIRMAHIVREFVLYKCGDIDADAAAILAALPKRCDRYPAYANPPPEKKRRPAVTATMPVKPVAMPAPIATTPAPKPVAAHPPAQHLFPETITPPRGSPARLATIRNVARRIQKLEGATT
jgi:hypothetical protein